MDQWERKMKRWGYFEPGEITKFTIISARCRDFLLYPGCATRHKDYDFKEMAKFMYDAIEGGKFTIDGTSTSSFLQLNRFGYVLQLYIEHEKEFLVERTNKAIMDFFLSLHNVFNELSISASPLRTSQDSAYVQAAIKFLDIMAKDLSGAPAEMDHPKKHLLLA